MSCRTDPADLVLACYGDLAPDRRRELEAHLQTCEACARERMLLGRILDAVTPAAVFPREAEVDWSRPLTCQAVRADLSAYLGGARDAAGDGDLPAHLARCPACASESAAISATLTAVRGAFPDEARVDWEAFTRETVRRARADEEEREDPGRRATTPFPTPAARFGAWRRLVPVAASVAAALAIGYVTLRWPLLEGPGNTPAPEVEMAQESTPLPGVAGPRPPSPDASLAGSPAGSEPGPATGPESGPAAGPETMARARTGAGPDRDIPGSAAPPAGAGATTGPDRFVASDDLLRRTRLEMAKSDAARYLADSRNLLLSFTELPVPCEGEKVDISVEREISSRLLRRKQFLDRDLQDVEVARARRVANEVESLLSEIALLENCVPPERVQEIRDLVGQRQLMMRIEMLTDELGAARGGRA